MSGQKSCATRDWEREGQNKNYRKHKQRPGVTSRGERSPNPTSVRARPKKATPARSAPEPHPRDTMPLTHPDFTP
ncbi:hypothetical protein VTO73DRAFT_938 [Trametes versicolor]